MPFKLCVVNFLCHVNASAAVFTMSDGSSNYRLLQTNQSWLWMPACLFWRAAAAFVQALFVIYF